MNFRVWLELTYPGDCSNRKIVSGAVRGGRCSAETGGSHDLIRTTTGGRVTVVPRHNKIHPVTCRQIIRQVTSQC